MTRRITGIILLLFGILVYSGIKMTEELSEQSAPQVYSLQTVSGSAVNPLKIEQVGTGERVSYRLEAAKIRLLALKHSRESMADGDADLALKAAQKAADKGLSIKGIGNHFINKDGRIQVVLWEYGSDLDKLKAFISDQMKVNAEPGDTVIVFTIGHGMGDGNLHNLGQRADVLKAIAGAAEENQQRTLWWQLSCHAAARLPDIKTLTPAQQELLTIVASSTASELSAAGVQGKVMERVFVAMAEKSQKIDPNEDGIVTAKELKDFLNND